MEVKMNPYQILNVSENCSDEELSKAYKALAKKYHPDVNPSPEAAKKMVEINCAYDEIKKMRALGMSYSQYSASQNTGYAQSSYSQNATGDERYYQALDQALRMGNFFMAFQYMNAIRNRDHRWYYYASALYEQFNNIPGAIEFINQAIRLKNDPVYVAAKQRLESKLPSYQAQMDELKRRQRASQAGISATGFVMIVLLIFMLVQCTIF